MSQILSLGTHDIHNLVLYDMTIDVQSTKISVTYSEHSCAAGALIIFVSETADFAFLPLGRSTSLDYTLPFELYPGQYRVLVYDIENDGTLASGVGYPAVDMEVVTNGTTQGIMNANPVKVNIKYLKYS